MSSDYRLAPALAARLLGGLLVLVALLVFVGTAAIALLELPPVLLLVLAATGVVAVFVTGWVLTRRTPVVRLDDTGYRVRLVRGAGVKAAAWTEVADAGTTTRGDLRCVELRLHDGRSTTIPVAALAADPEAFVRDLREHLRRGEGLRPLGDVGDAG